MRQLGLILLLLGAAGGACGGGDVIIPGSDAVCSPGETSACLGAGGCSGAQVCNSEGLAFGICDCGIGDAGLPDAKDSRETNAPEAAPSDASISDVAPDSEDSSSEVLTTDASADGAPDIDAAPAPVTPDKLSDLALWLDADKGLTMCPDGTSAQVWADQSGNFNNAKGCPVGGEPGPRLLKADIKGHDALEFGTGLHRTVMIDDDPGLQFATGAFCIIAVVKVVDTGTAAHLFFKPAPTGGGFVDFFLDGSLNFKTLGADGKALIANSTYHVVVARGPALELRVDGVNTKGKTSTDDISFPGTSVVIGRGGGPDVITYDLAELIAAKGTVTDTQLAGVEAYLKGRYKFTW